MIWFSVNLKYPKNLLLILLPVLELLPVYCSVCRRSWTWQKPFGIFSYYYYYHFFVKPLPVESSSFRFSSLSSEYDLKMMTVSVKSVRWFNWFWGCWTFPAWHTGLSDDVSLNWLLLFLLIPRMKRINQLFGFFFLVRHVNTNKLPVLHEPRRL